MSKFPDDETIEAWVRLHRAQRSLLETVEGALKKNELPPLEWYDVLLELHRQGDGRLRQFEIGQRVLLSKHNLSRLIDRLEQQGLVSRQACKEDGRGYQIRMTKDGEKLLKQMWPVYGRSIQEQIGEKLNLKEITELARLMGKLLS